MPAPMNNQDEFYVGWQASALPGIGSYVRKIVLAVFILVLAAACLLPLAQRTIGSAVFEWGTIKTFTGILQAQPYPHLLVLRPGQGGGQSAYYLVAPFKFGLDQKAIAKATQSIKGLSDFKGVVMRHRRLELRMADDANNASALANVFMTLADNKVNLISIRSVGQQTEQAFLDLVEKEESRGFARAYQQQNEAA